MAKPIMGVEITGFPQLERKFQTLSKTMQTQTIKRASKRGADLVLAEARRLAPVNKNNVARLRQGKFFSLAGEISITEVRGRQRGRRIVGHQITTSKRAFYGASLELGTKPRARRSRRRFLLVSTGRIPQKEFEFLRPALLKYRRAINRLFVREVKRAVAKVSEKSQSSPSSGGGGGGGGGRARDSRGRFI